MFYRIKCTSKRFQHVTQIYMHPHCVYLKFFQIELTNIACIRSPDRIYESSKFQSFTKYADSSDKKKNDCCCNNLSRMDLPDQTCDILAVPEAQGVRFSSLEWPHKALRHLVFPMVSNSPRSLVTARKD